MIEIFKLLKRHQHSNINAKDINGNTILHCAIKNGNFTPEEKIKVLKISLDKGLDPNIKNNKNETIWHLAIANQSKEVIDFLLTRKIYFDDTVALYLIGNEHNKVAEWARQSQMSDDEIHKLEKDSASFIEWIFSKDVNLDCLNRLKMGILLLAIDYNVQHILPTVLKYTNDIDYIEYKTERTLLHIFLEKNASLRNTHTSKPTETWYSKYSERYATNIVNILLDKGVSPEAVDKNGDTALHLAIKNKENISIVEMLIKRSKNTNCRNHLDETPFSIAMYKWGWSRESETDDYMKICRELIAKGTDVNQLDINKTSPLCDAVGSYNLPAVELLLENGADFSVITEDGSLLHLFAVRPYLKRSNEDVVKLFKILIDNHCDVDEKDEEGRTPLHIAAYFGDLIIIRMLIEHGADIEARNNRGETPLRYLSKDIERTYAAEFLLEHRANVNAKDINGYTPLHATAVGSRTESNLEMLKLLLKYGADFSARVDAGHSVLRLALWYDYNEGKYDWDKVKPERISSLSNCELNYASEEVEILLEHWIKLHVANLRCSTGFEYGELVAINKYKQYQEKCLKEIEILKTTFVDSRMSLYNLLRVNLNSRRAYLYNEKLLQLLKCPKLEKQFPEYAVLILSSYCEAVLRKFLMRASKMIWLYVTEISLPEVCMELIFSFLSNADLFDFIKL